MINKIKLLFKRGRLADFLMSSAFRLTFVLTTLGKSGAMFRSRSVESTSNKFENLTTAVDSMPVMPFRQWLIFA